MRGKNSVSQISGAIAGTRFSDPAVDLTQRDRNRLTLITPGKAGEPDRRESVSAEEIAQGEIPRGSVIEIPAIEGSNPSEWVDLEKRHREILFEA